jgi:hypothetical protein
LARQTFALNTVEPGGLFSAVWDSRGRHLFLDPADARLSGGETSTVPQSTIIRLYICVPLNPPSGVVYASASA